MNYRHAFHAGNFGDVLKHIVLVALLERLAQKDKPFFFLDTHAGRGRYDLDGEAARKSGEASAGIRLLAEARDLPPLVARYLGLVRAFDPANAERIRFYPGSPCIAAMLMRPDDRAALCELAPREAESVRREFAHDGRFAIHLRDGYEALKALLPPKERRGLALIDRNAGAGARPGRRLAGRGTEALATGCLRGVVPDQASRDDRGLSRLTGGPWNHAAAGRRAVGPSRGQYGRAERLRHDPAQPALESRRGTLRGPAGRACRDIPVRCGRHARGMARSGVSRRDTTP
jgi:hypothetical protein